MLNLLGWVTTCLVLRVLAGIAPSFFVMILQVSTLSVGNTEFVPARNLASVLHMVLVAHYVCMICVIIERMF